MTRKESDIVNFICDTPRTPYKRRTLHVPNLIRGEKKYHPYCLKEGNLLKKVKVTKPGYSCFDFSVICVLLWQGDS